MIYLLHFSRPFRGVKHYLGYTEDLEARLKRHGHGRGANLTRLAKKEGITWECVRTWPGDRTEEKRLKQQGAASRLCPLCGPTYWKDRWAKRKAKKGNHAKEVCDPGMLAGTQDGGSLFGVLLVVDADQPPDTITIRGLPETDQEVHITGLLVPDGAPEKEADPEEERGPLRWWLPSR